MIFYALLIIIVPVVFSPCLKAQFLHWDDYGHYIYNPCVYSLSWHNICNIFLQVVNETYIPLTTLSFDIENHLFGHSSFSSHLINVLLHLATVLVIFDLARKMKFSPWESFIASLIFALHPIHVESVAWVTERKDVLGILFYVLSLRAYWMWLEGHSQRNYVLSLTFGFLSILTKAMAVSLPWTLLLLDWYYQRRWSKSVLLDKLPFAFLIFPFAAITFFKLSPHPEIGGSSILVGLWTFSWYLEKFFWPIDLFPAYTPPVPVLLSNFIYMRSLIIFAVFCISMVLWRKNRLFIFASLFWIGTIFFFWRFDFGDNNIVADRFMYLPSLGFCLWLGRYLSPYKLVAGLIVIILGVLTFEQCHVWENDLTLWSWTISHDPKNVIAKNKLDEAVFGLKIKDVDYRTIKDLTKAIDNNPQDSGNYVKRGEYLLNQDSKFLAFHDFDQAVRIDPNNFEAHNLRGQLYLSKQEFEKALEDFNKAIAIKPDNASTYFEKALLLESMGDRSQALSWFGYAIKINPKLGGAYYERGMLYFNSGEYKKAIDDFSKSILFKNNLKGSYLQRGKCYEELKQLDMALEDFNRSLTKDPYDITILNKIGLVYLADKNEPKAIEIFNKTVSMHPYWGDAYNNRGIIHLDQKRYDQALKDFSDVIRVELYPYHALITRGDIYFVIGYPKKALADFNTAILFSNGDPVGQMKRDHLESILGIH